MLKYETEYAYAVGRIRVIENRLLNRGLFDRMIDAATTEEILRILQEAGYGESEDESINLYDGELLLKQEYKNLYGLLKSIVPKPDIFNIFLLKNDYHNLKVLLKSEYGGFAQGDLLLDTGIIPVIELKLMIRDRKLGDLSSIMYDAFNECTEVFNKTSDPQMIDVVLDKASAKEAKAMATVTQNKFLIELCSMSIDLVNIKTFLRVKLMGKPRAFLESVILSGGSLDLDLYTDNFDIGIEGLIENLSNSRYEAILGSSQESYEKGNLAMYEKLSDNLITAFVSKAKHDAFGIEPLIAYLYAKENEIKNVRIVITGKANDIPGDTIRERLREIYV